MARIEELDREGEDMVNYAVRRWRQVRGESKHVDQLLSAPSPEAAAHQVAEDHGDVPTRRWGPYLHLHPPILYLLGCNSDDLESPDQTSVEIYDPKKLPPNWTGPTT